MPLGQPMMTFDNNVCEPRKFCNVINESAAATIAECTLG